MGDRWKQIEQICHFALEREDVRKGAEELGVLIEEHIAFCIAAMREAADELGLRGNPAANG